MEHIYVKFTNKNQIIRGLNCERFYISNFNDVLFILYRNEEKYLPAAGNFNDFRDVCALVHCERQQ